MATRLALRNWIISALAIPLVVVILAGSLFVVRCVGKASANLDPVLAMASPDHLTDAHFDRGKTSPATQTIDQLTLARSLDSGDAEVRQTAISQINQLAMNDPKSLAIGLPQWIAPLLRIKQFGLLDQISLAAISERAFDPVTVQSAQRARVTAFIGEGDYEQALKEAKGYYNAAAISETADAVDLLTQILLKTREPTVAADFKAEQQQAGTDRNILPSIEVDPSPYVNAIDALKAKRGGKRGLSHNSLMALGDLLLLTDQASDAKACFEAACRTEATSGQNLRQAMEGVAKAMRAQDGNVASADAFITSMRLNPSQTGTSLARVGSASWEEMRIAAQQIALSNLQTMLLPPLEQQRAIAENTGGAVLAPTIVSGFEGSTPIYVATISPTHLVVEITTPGFRDWFMFRLKGVAGKTVRVDITGAYKTVPDWSQKAWSVNPVYTYASKLDDPAVFSGVPTTGHMQANNGTILPITPGQSWQYISTTWSDQYTLSFVQRFESDSAYIAMRVPRTVTYNERFLSGLNANPLSTVVEIGRSAQGRPLRMAQIGSASNDKSCILIYAGEHPDEPDAGWVAQGAIQYLLSDLPAAVKLRENYTFLIIPLLDPDAAAAGIHQSIITSFLPGHTTKESIAYADWFQAWISAGNRLDVAIDLHNIQSGEGPHVFCPLIESSGARGSLSLALHKTIINNIQNAGYGAQLNPQMRGWMPGRLCGWLSHYYGTFSIAYEINSQAPERHLSSAETTALGGVFAQSIGDFLGGNDGDSLMAIVDTRRRERVRQLAAYLQPIETDNAISSEADVLKHASADGEFDSTEKAIP